MQSRDQRSNACLHIALYQPEIPPNTGNIARTCAAIGAVLHLIEPLGFSLDDRHLRRAGLDYWPLVDLRLHRDLRSLRSELPGIPVYCVENEADTVYSEVSYPSPCLFLLGRETSGLPAEILRTERCVRIPMRAGARCLNLSNAAAVVAYEFMRQHGFPAQRSG